MRIKWRLWSTQARAGSKLPNLASPLVLHCYVIKHILYFIYIVTANYRTFNIFRLSIVLAY